MIVKLRFAWGHFPGSSASHKVEEPGGSSATFVYSHFMGQRAVPGPMALHGKPFSNPSSCGEVWLPLPGRDETPGHHRWLLETYPRMPMVYFGAASAS